MFRKLQECSWLCFRALEEHQARLNRAAMAQGTVQPLWLLVLQATLILNQPDFNIFLTLTLIKLDIKFSNKKFSDFFEIFWKINCIILYTHHLNFIWFSCFRIRVLEDVAHFSLDQGKCPARDDNEDIYYFLLTF